MNGASPGTSGWRVFLWSAAAAAPLVVLINALNVITRLHEHPLEDWRAPVIWETSSWISLMAFLWIPWLAFRLAPPLRAPWWRPLLVHPAGLVAFGFFHVVGFVALRKIAYAALGAHYEFGSFGRSFVYELSKDAFGYVLIVTGFTIIERIVTTTAIAAATPGAATYSIRDGNCILRVPMADILAVSSAGNYVEFSLRDGRKPLMRSPLSALETELAPHGFVRTHRSWLVNAMQMTGLKPEGSGDYTVELGELRVPLSRRFPEALAKLRAG